MKSITTRIGTFLTGSDIADAVLSYGTALSNARRLDSVDIPVVVRDGTTRRVRFVVGWMIDLTVTTTVSPEGGEMEELEEPGTVLDLLDRAASAGVVRRARPFTPGELANLPPFDLDFYLD